MRAWERARTFLTEVWSELKKTTWPARKEVYGTTFVVIIVVIVCALFLYGVDMILRPLAQMIYPSP